MAGLRFTELQSRPMEFLDFTSLTLDEFQQLVPPFETAFHARMAAWRMDGKPRTARRFTVYKNCPPRHRKTSSCSSWSTSKPTPPGGARAYSAWSRAKPISGSTSLPARWRRRCPRRCPARSLSALAQRLGVSEAAAATVVTPLEEESAPVVAVPTAAPAALFAHDGTERRIVRPQDPAEQTACYMAKKDHTVKCPARQCAPRHPLAERHPRRPCP